MSAGDWLPADFPREKRLIIIQLPARAAKRRKKKKRDDGIARIAGCSGGHADVMAGGNNLVRAWTRQAEEQWLHEQVFLNGRAGKAKASVTAYSVSDSVPR